MLYLAPLRKIQMQKTPLLSKLISFHFTFASMLPASQECALFEQWNMTQRLQSDSKASLKRKGMFKIMKVRKCIMESEVSTLNRY